MVMTTMKAIRVYEFGDSKQLKFESNVLIPQLEDSQVIVEVKAVGVNPIDPYVRNGGFGPQPFPTSQAWTLQGTLRQLEEM